MSYWIFEFIKVFVSYVFLMYLWPSVVFRKILSGKSLTYRFGFCSTISVLLTNTFVLLLGLFHILKPWIVFLVFYGTFIVSILKDKNLRRCILHQIEKLISGTLGWKSFLADLATNTKKIITTFFYRINKKTKGKKIEYGILSVLLVFAILYFSYGAFQNHSYGWGDMYVHHAWIQGLKEGTIFSAGVYPEAMHCFIYSMNVLSGVSVYSCMLFLGEIHVATLLVAVYCLFRNIMRSKYTVYLILTAFLTVDVVCVDEIYGMSRLQYTIPQEFGLYTLFLCPLFLINFLRRDFRSEKKKSIFNEDLFLFMTSLAASLAIHFYVTIMAFFLCVSFAIFGINRIFRKKNFGALTAAVIIGVVISTLPMVLAFATGTPLQGSLNWGMNVINGTDTKEGRTQAAQTVTEENTESSTENTADNNKENDPTVTENSSNENRTGSALTNNKENPTSQIQHSSFVETAKQTAIQKLKLLYQYGYKQLYNSTRAKWLVLFTMLAAFLSLLNVLIFMIRFKKFPFEMYTGITIASVLFMLLYAAPFLGLPEIIAGARLCLPEQIFLLAMMAVPVDELFFLLGKTPVRYLAPQLSLAGVIAIFVGTNYLGIYHGYLYYELTRYNSAVKVTNKIMDTYPQYSYTIVSTTDELYQIVEHARHEEILNFYMKSKLEDYYLPTKYIFFYIEKQPIYYAQYHFFSGPKWLALDKYTEYYKYSNAVLSVGNEIQHTEISDRSVGSPLVAMGKSSDAYSLIENRKILESEMYNWCQNFKSSLPNEIEVYYEDEDFICYIVKQNPERLYNLGK